MKLARKSQKGFTLVELVIVMAVIALILSVVIPNLRGMQQEGQLTKAESELQTLKTAITSFWRHNSNTYPADISAALVGATPQVVTAQLVDPFNTSNGTYGYVKDANNDYFIVWTQGPKKDTAQPTVSNGEVVYSGSGRCVSNLPVKKQ